MTLVLSKHGFSLLGCSIGIETIILNFYLFCPVVFAGKSKNKKKQLFLHTLPALLFVDLSKELTQAFDGLAAAIEEFLGTGHAGEAGGGNSDWQASAEDFDGFFQDANAGRLLDDAAHEDS
jgi:hypothetical protein